MGASSLTGGPRGAEFYSASGTFTVPNGVYKVYVTAAAAGGGGANTGAAGYGGGGAGDCVLKKPVTVTPGQAITVTIGNGGIAGSAGGVTSFGALVSITGGGAGSTSVGGNAGGPGGGAGTNAESVSRNGIGGEAPFGYGRGGHGGLAGNKGFLLVEWF